ncbi:MAG: PaaI family thioesterase, partial [Prevotellaceae bacterium]|nr:PaaI family thioesterase [Prevotellaceae bacterium]
MKKIINPWEGMPGYNCIGCSPDHPFGFHLHFYEDGEYIVSQWQPTSDFQGWVNTLHGGIQALLLDEICGWVVTRKL